MYLLALIHTQSRAPGGMWKHLLIPTTGWGDKIYHLAQGGMPIRERGQFTKFIGIVGGKGWGATPTLDYSNIAL